MREWTLRCLYWFGLEVTLLGRIATGGRRFWASQAALGIGVAYLVGPVDLIPGCIPFVGHLDELAFLVVGLVAAHWLAPRRETAGRRAEAGLSRPASGPVTPNFFIVGAPRCGTTSLFSAMCLHPDVFGCPVKEPNHFATDRNARPHVIASAVRRGVLLTEDAPARAVLPRVATTPGFDTYLRLFDGWAGEHAVGEASTSYLLSRTAAREIARRRPDARIIVALRQPVQRTQSEYLMHTQLGRTVRGTGVGDAADNGPDDMDTISFSTIVEASLYAPQIERYLQVFDREQLLFLRFEDLARAPADALRQVFRHVGIDPDVDVRITLSHQNQSRPVRFPVLNRLLFKSGFRDAILHGLPRPVRRLFARHYYAARPAASLPAMPADLLRQDITETEKLTGLDLSDWFLQLPAAQ